ncbi:hypothetical protein KL918_001800 [Ogataea parapolymorpha]|uniref:NGG1p interacting factor 3 family n=1 Tax=Ogataea parapolymorpha (strain ATCC 26012 / BCRC 20466 / JCM 22074 / NRRL Y-7560 / DL-1) TaxID=871575 RepID=W1QE42_OGAPD|nr:NGG1p interacting factor 3 family [Ogataea parapolymorpha DL-1]ESW98809.1 NGG1p interacting factor 3 family [Ogataea parapolymorpha DL-1]KAG7868142.1 hypothetical protein KL918_001800 [Ogataea parapolymorpha]KAG7874238.1 hypothetical protein KL916_001578 [Ogataea parapolymorpha]
MSSPARFQRVVAGIQKLYPIAYADSSWDNTGLLVDASGVNKSEKFHILLTVDLTQSVVEEAIRARSSLVLAYHPFIFRGLKSITPNDPQQSSLIKLIHHGISVYCPHTSVDAAKGGVNDWLALALGEIREKAVIEKNAADEDVGMGRLVTLSRPASLKELVPRIKTHLGINHLQLATKIDPDTAAVTTVAVCAGSGGSVFRNLDADLYLTGELSHHEALYFKEKGSSVIICNHSNTERGFLSVLKEQLAREFDDPEITIDISATDEDPFVIV